MQQIAIFASQTPKDFITKPERRYSLCLSMSTAIRPVAHSDELPVPHDTPPPPHLHFLTY